MDSMDWMALLPRVVMLCVTRDVLLHGGAWSTVKHHSYQQFPRLSMQVVLEVQVERMHKHIQGGPPADNI